MTSPANFSTTSPAPFSPSVGYRRYVLIVITMVTAINVLDRQLIGILGPQVQADLGLEDWQMGIVQGLAFAVLYTFAAIPVARWADKSSRVTVITVAITAWSAFTGLCGLVQNFVQLALARAGVAIGEAGATPPSHALISDYYPKETRAQALAIVNIGVSIGVASAFFASGYMSEKLGWRMTFILMMFPGLLLALILKLTVREDPNRLKALGEQNNEGQPKDIAIMWQTAKKVLAIPTYLYTLLGTSCMAIVTYAVGNWIMYLFARSFPEFPFTTLTVIIGFISLFALSFSSYMGGYLVDRFAKRNLIWYCLIPAISLVLFFPAVLSFVWAPTIVGALAGVVGINLLAGVYLGPSYALAQTLAPPSMRALSTAVFLAIYSLIGLSVGPTLTGILSSAFTPQYGADLALKLALSIVSSFAVIAGILYMMAARHVKADWANLERE